MKGSHRINEDWKRQINDSEKSILFVDEGNRFLPWRKFADVVKNSDSLKR